MPMEAGSPPAAQPAGPATITTNATEDSIAKAAKAEPPTDGSSTPKAAAAEGTVPCPFDPTKQCATAVSEQHKPQKRGTGAAGNLTQCLQTSEWALDAITRAAEKQNVADQLTVEGASTNNEPDTDKKRRKFKLCSLSSRFAPRSVILSTLATSNLTKLIDKYDQCASQKPNAPTFLQRFRNELLVAYKSYDASAEAISEQQYQFSVQAKMKNTVTSQKLFAFYVFVDINDDRIQCIAHYDPDFQQSHKTTMKEIADSCGALAASLTASLANPGCP